MDDGYSNQEAQPGLLSNSKALFRNTSADCGVIECPMITPHFSWHAVNGGAVVLASECFNASLYGKLYADLLPLVDGVRQHREILEALSDKYPQIKVKTALVRLAAKGYAISADFSMSAGQAAYWTSLGASPRYVEQTLPKKPVAVVGNPDDAGLAASLSELGVCVAEGGATPALTLVVTEDYLDAAHEAFNRDRIADGQPWLLVRHRGIAPLAGPVFTQGGACWSCLAHRYRGNREIENFLRNITDNERPLDSCTNNPVMGRAFASIAAVEVAKWLVFGDVMPVSSNVLSLEPVRPMTHLHKVHKRPQCLDCGAPVLNRIDRAPEPVAFRSRPKPFRNSGGVRAVPPEETVRRYGHLVSPVSGVVTQLMRTTDSADEWLHVYWAGSNLALRNDQLHLLRASLRTKSSGKGSTRAQAEASALCEAVERYSGVFQGDEIRIRRRFADFADGEALHPNTIQLYSDRQYTNADQINSRGSRFNYVPARFDPDAGMDWTPVWSMTDQRFRYLPTSMLYYSTPSGGEPIYCGPDSNGCAAGNTLEEAVLQGFFELVERDAFACWWYNRIQRPEVDLSTFQDPYLSGAQAYYRKFSRDIWVLDVTHDLGVPVFVAVSRRTDKDVEDIIFSAGSHFDPKIAALRAVCELNQYLQAVRNVTSTGEGYLYDDPEAMAWWHTAKLENETYLAPAPDRAVRRAEDYASYESDDILDDVKRCQGLVESRGLEFIVLDQTRPDIGMPVAKVIVPGMRHFWSRLGSGRLYDVPVDLGWLDRPRAEDELNPIAVFV